MELPKHHQTYTPILKTLKKTLKDRQEWSTRDLILQVRDNYYSELPESVLREITSSGANRLNDRIRWGISYLKMANFLSSPSRGMIQITEKGKSSLPTRITYKSLLDDPDYLAHVASRKTKKKADKVNDPKEVNLGEASPQEEVNLGKASPQDLIDAGLSTIEEQTKRDLLEELHKTDPSYFESVILQLLKKMGYGDFIETPKSWDGGIDGVINSDELGLEKIYIQAKRYKDTNVSEKDIRDFIGAMSGDTNKGIFVTTSDFRDNALKKARQAAYSIILIDGDKLVDLMYKHNVGVQVRDTYEVKTIDGDFFDQS